MKFSFFTMDKKYTSFNIEVGKKWAMYPNKQNFPVLNSILSGIDNGNGIVDEAELEVLNKFITSTDLNQDGKITFDEFKKLGTTNADNIIGHFLAFVMNDDVTQRNAFGLPTTGKNFIKHINLINANNVEQVICSYSHVNQSKETIFDGIIGEVGIPAKKRCDAILRIFKLLSINYAKKGIKTDDILSKLRTELKNQSEKLGVMNADEINNIYKMFKTKDAEQNKEQQAQQQALENHNSLKKYYKIENGNALIIPRSTEINEFAKSQNRYLLWAIYKDSLISYEDRIKIIKKSIAFIKAEARGYNVDCQDKLNEINKLLNDKNIDIGKISKLSYDIAQQIKHHHNYPEIGKNIKDIEKNKPTDSYSLIKKYRQVYKNHNIFEDLIYDNGLSKENKIKYITKLTNDIAVHYNLSGVFNQDLLVEFNSAINQYANATKDNEDELQEKILDIIKSITKRKYYNSQKANNKDANGKIDSDFEQGQVGDCWLLAVIKAISLKEKGLKTLNDSISVDKNGNVSVYLKGVHKKYTFSKTEIESRRDLSRGDLDVRAIEMAVERYIKETGAGDLTNNSYSLNGNHETFAYKLLLGTYGAYQSEEERKNAYKTPLSSISGRNIQFNNSLLEDFNNPNKIYCVSACGDKETIILSDNEDSNAVLMTDHAYTVVKSDAKYVYLINPHNSAEIFEVEREQFLKFFNCFVSTII